MDHKKAIIMKIDEVERHYQRGLDKAAIASKGCPKAIALRRADPVTYWCGLAEWANEEGIIVE